MSKPKKLTTKEKSKGGAVTKAATLERQQVVEQLMLEGDTIAEISNYSHKGKKLGAENTISKDMDIVRSKWLESDPTWFHRARIARIEAKNRLLMIFKKQMNLIKDLESGDYDIKAVWTKEGQVDLETKENRGNLLTRAYDSVTKTIAKIYEIDSDFDPEQYIDMKIQESIKDKITVTETTISR